MNKELAGIKMESSRRGTTPEQVTALKLAGVFNIKDGKIIDTYTGVFPDWDRAPKFQSNTAAAKTKELGGIDMNPSALAIEETATPATTFSLPVNATGIPVITGLVPVILDIRPVENLRELLTTAR